ncbi:MAG: RHS repeat-associated core domain-containing protein [Actinomycetota bacterium]
MVDTYVWSENRLSSKTNGAGNTTRFGYIDLGLVDEVTLPPRNEARDSLHPDAPTREVVIELDYQRPEASTYDSAVAELTAVTQDAAAAADEQRRREFGYDADGNLETITERSNQTGAPDRITRLTYYDPGLLRTIDGPLTDFNDVTSFGDQVGTYGGAHRTGQMRTVTDGRAKVSNFDYTPYGRTLEVINRDGHTQTMDYDERDNLVSSSDGEGHTTSFAYDANGNLAVERAPKGHSNTPLGSGSFETRYLYDAMDRAVRVTTPTETETLRAETTMDYFSDGTLAAERVATDSGQRVTDYAYHPNQLIKSLTEDAGSGDKAVTDYLYDDTGRLEQTTLPSNSSGVRPVAELSYTPASEVWRYATTASSDGQSQRSRVTTLSFSAHGETIEVRGPRSVAGRIQRQEQSYDNFGQLELRRQLLNDPAASGGERWLSHTYDYDLAGNLETLTQPNAHQGSLTTTYDYDVLNRLQEQSDPFDDRHVTRFTYSDEGLQEQRTEIRRESGTDTTLRTITSDYNDDDTLRTRIAVEGDAYLAQCNYQAGSPEASGFDANGNLLYSRTIKGTGTAGCGGVAPLSSKSFTYGNRDLATAVTQSIDDPTTTDQGDGSSDDTTRRQELSYRRDGLLARSAWNAGTPEEKVTTYDHSPGGLLEGVTDWRDRTSTFDYAPAGNLTETRFGGDVAQGALAYHSDGSLQSLRWSDSLGVPLRSHTGIDYDPGGLKTSESIDVLPAGEMTDPGGTASFDYDLLGRLTGWHNPFAEVPIGQEPSHAYGLDDAGNITREEVTGAAEDVTITQNYVQGRLSERRAQSDAGVATLTVDDYSVMGEEKQRTISLTPTGGPTTSETLTTDHDAQGHTASMTHSPSGGKPKVDFVYDADDRLMARTSDGRTKLFFYYFGDTSRVAEETSASGATKTLYCGDSAGRPLAEVKDDNWTWLLRDAEGSVATRLSDSGNVKSHSAYDPYGATNEAGSGIAVGERDPETELGYQSEAADAVTGNILVGPRQYDPTTQRFTTADVFIDAGSDLALAIDPLTGNRYLFAAANPVALDDDGHAPMCDGTSYCAPGPRESRDSRSRAAPPASAGYSAALAADHQAVAVVQELQQQVRSLTVSGTRTDLTTVAATPVSVRITSAQAEFVPVHTGGAGPIDAYYRYQARISYANIFVPYEGGAKFGFTASLRGTKGRTPLRQVPPEAPTSPTIRAANSGSAFFSGYIGPDIGRPEEIVFKIGATSGRGGGRGILLAQILNDALGTSTYALPLD